MRRMLTVLSVAALDQTLGTQTNPNGELMANGAANLVCGAIGGAAAEVHGQPPVSRAAAPGVTHGDDVVDPVPVDVGDVDASLLICLTAVGEVHAKILAR